MPAYAVAYPSKPRLRDMLTRQGWPLPPLPTGAVETPCAACGARLAVLPRSARLAASRGWRIYCPGCSEKRPAGGRRWKRFSDI